MLKKSNLRNTAAGILFSSMISLSFSTGGAMAEENTRTGVHKAKGQTIYTPTYSHIYSGNKQAPLYVAATLIIRNTDTTNSLTLVSADYFDSAGKIVRKYLEKPVVIAPLASTRYFVSESDKEGGSGASFIVKWKSDDMICQPIVESIMVSTQFQQGVSFTSRGEVIEESK